MTLDCTDCVGYIVHCYTCKCCFASLTPITYVIVKYQPSVYRIDIRGHIAPFHYIILCSPSVMFDYEEQQQYTSLYVFATDDGPGSPLNSVPSNLVVNIANRNDNPPAFAQRIWGKHCVVPTPYQALHVISCSFEIVLEFVPFASLRSCPMLLLCVQYLYYLFYLHCIHTSWCVSDSWKCA